MQRLSERGDLDARIRARARTARRVLARRGERDGLVGRLALLPATIGRGATNVASEVTQDLGRSRAKRRTLSSAEDLPEECPSRSDPPSHTLSERRAGERASR